MHTPISSEFPMEVTKLEEMAAPIWGVLPVKGKPSRALDIHVTQEYKMHRQQTTHAWRGWPEGPTRTFKLVPGECYPYIHHILEAPPLHPHGFCGLLPSPSSEAQRLEEPGIPKQ